MLLTPFKRCQLKMRLLRSRTRNSQHRLGRLSEQAESSFRRRCTMGRQNVQLLLSPVPFKASFERWPLLIRLFVIVLPGLFLSLCSSGCVSVPPTPMVIQQCKGLDQFLVATPEPEARNETEGSKDETHASLQGALQECNADKRSARDAIRAIMKGEKK